MAKKSSPEKTVSAPRPAQGGISKQEAVRRALAELGENAKPSEIKPFVKERFGIEMSADHISTAKGTILKQAKGKKKRRPAAKKEAAPTAPAPPAPRPGTESGKAGAGISLDDIRTVRDLLDRVGADRLRALVELLAR
jgi:hypothetical protein